MAEYIERDEFLKRIKPYNTSDKMDKALYNFALNKMIQTPTADVIERSKIDKAIEEIRKEIEENHLNVIGYAEGEWITKDFIYGAIERFKRNIGE